MVKNCFREDIYEAPRPYYFLDEWSANLENIADRSLSSNSRMASKNGSSWNRIIGSLRNDELLLLPRIAFDIDIYEAPRPYYSDEWSASLITHTMQCIEDSFISSTARINSMVNETELP